MLVVNHPVEADHGFVWAETWVIVPEGKIRIPLLTGELVVGQLQDLGAVLQHDPDPALSGEDDPRPRPGAVGIMKSGIVKLMRIRSVVLHQVDVERVLRVIWPGEEEDPGSIR